MTHLIRSLTLVLATCALASTLSAAEAPDLDPHLEPLRPWLGKTWRGEFKNSTPEKPVVDVSRWERALNGKAVRILHSINDGVYGGESLVVWDEKKQAVAYYYFTTAGFMTTGTMTFKDGKIISHEVVSGSAGGTSEVRATTEMRADGSYHVTAEYLKEGGGTIGRETTCKVDAAATVMFK